MAFLTPLDLRAYKSGEWVVLIAVIFADLTGKRFIVPQGFITDLASIPFFLRGVFNVNGLSREPAVLHDWLYCVQYTTRAEADALFLEALKGCGVGWATRYGMYLAVRAGGWMYWSDRDDGLEQSDFVDADYFGA